MPEPRIVLRKRIVREENDRLGKNPHPKGMIKHFEYADKARFNLAKKIAETISENEHERQKIEQFLIQGKKATGELLRLRDPELRKKIEEEIDALSHFHQFSDANLMRHITGEGESDFIEQILDKFKGIVVREEFLERKGIAESLKYMRGTDRILSRGIHNTYYNGRNLSDYDAISGINIIGLVNELLKKGNASILDIGCGKGIALRNIMEKIKGKKRKKLRLSGLTLARLSEHEQAKKEGVEIRIGRIETKRLDSQYDLIFSIAGGLHYSQTPIKALEKTLAALKLGGIALIDSGQEKKIEKYLEQEYPGFVYRKTSSSRLIIQKSPNNNALEELIKRHAFHLPGS